MGKVGCPGLSDLRSVQERIRSPLSGSLQRNRGCSWVFGCRRQGVAGVRQLPARPTCVACLQTRAAPPEKGVAQTAMESIHQVVKAMWPGVSGHSMPHNSGQRMNGVAISSRVNCLVRLRASLHRCPVALQCTTPSVWRMMVRTIIYAIESRFPAVRAHSTGVPVSISGALSVVKHHRYCRKAGWDSNMRRSVGSQI